MREHRRDVEVFGGVATIVVAGRAPDGTTPELAAARVAVALRRIHATLTRFDCGSELSRLNADPRAVVPAGPLVLALARAVRTAGERSGGLVDGTQLGALEDAGYADSRAGWGAPPAERLRATPVAPALPDPGARWAQVAVDGERGAVVRPPGVRLDGGGLVKGLAADLAADRLAPHARFAVDCGGDLRVGGAAGDARAILVERPLGGPPLPWRTIARGAVATSAIARRWWEDGTGGVSHHLLDPGRGRPAFTGLLQVTALARPGLEAEIRAKAALLAGPDGARRHLPDGGVLFGLDGEPQIVPPADPARTEATSRRGVRAAPPDPPAADVAA